MTPSNVFQVVCPYCGTKNAVIKEGFEPETDVYLCDSEVGGCDLRFVVNMTMRFDYSVQRIEGEIDKLEAKP